VTSGLQSQTEPDLEWAGAARAACLRDALSGLVDTGGLGGSGDPDPALT
jgi:hypothetical protein